jgi:hypothetical protein
MNSAATRATHPRTNPGGPSGTSTPEEERLIRLASHVWTRDCRPDSGQGIRCARPVPDQPHDHLHARWPALSATTRGVIPGAWLYMRNFIQREWRLERIIVRSVSSRFSLTRSAPRCAGPHGHPGRSAARTLFRPGRDLAAATAVVRWPVERTDLAARPSFRRNSGQMNSLDGPSRPIMMSA